MGKGSGSGGNTSTVTSQQAPNPAFQQAYQNLTNQAQQVASNPLSQYGGSLVAGFTPQQAQAFDTVSNLQGQYAPYLNSAAQSFNQATQPLWPSLPQFDTSGLPQGATTAINNAQQYAGAAAQPIAQQLYPYTESAMGAASNMTGNAYPYAALATQPINTQPYTGFGLNTAQNLPGQVSPYTGQASGIAQNLPGQVSPYANTASQAAGSAPGLINAYQSPYTQQVTSALQNLFNQQNAQQLAQVRGSSVGQGAYGGDREGVAEALTSQQQQLAEAPTLAQTLQQGYQSSVQAAQQQAALQAQTGLGAGQLTTQAGLGAGQLGLGAGQLTSQTGLGAGQLGLGAGQLGLQGQLGQGQLGLGAGNLINQAGAQQGQLALGAGGLLNQGLTAQGQLGLGAAQTNLGAAQQQYGMFSTQQQQQLAAEQANAWLNSQAGFGLSALGSEAQNLGLSGAQALMGTGGMQQQLAQEQLNVPYEQFLQQQAYPFQTTGWLGNLVEGLGSAAGGTSSTSYPGPSALSQIGGLGLGAAGLAAATGGSNGLWGGLFGQTPASYTAGLAAPIAGTGGLTPSDLLNAPNDIVPPVATGGRVGTPREGLASGGIPGIDMPSPISPIPISTDVPDVNVSVMPPGAPPGKTSPIVSSLANPGTTQTTTGSGSDGGVSAGSVLGGLGSLASIARLALAIPFAGGGRVGYQDGGVATPGSGYPLISESGGLAHLPQTPKIGLDSIVPPGPAVKMGRGLPKPPQSGPDAPGSHTPSPLQDLQAGEQIGKGLDKLSQSRGGVVGIPHPHLGGGLFEMSHIAKPQMGMEHVGFDTGGEVSPLTAAAPLSETSPNTQSFYQQLTQMPVERLREMSVRIPPTTSQGQLIQRALAAKEMTPGAGTAQTQQPPAGGLASLPGQQQQQGMGLGAGSGIGGIGGFAEGGAIPEDPDADPHPIVDHSGKTVVIHYPSEGKSLDLGIPSMTRGMADGGRQTTGQASGSSDPQLAQLAQSSNEGGSGPQLSLDQVNALVQASPTEQGMGGGPGFLQSEAMKAAPLPAESSGSTGGVSAQQNILNNALAPPPAHNPGFDIPRPQAINPFANIQVPPPVDVGRASIPRPMTYQPLNVPQLSQAPFQPSGANYNFTSPALPQLPIPGGNVTTPGLSGLSNTSSGGLANSLLVPGGSFPSGPANAPRTDITATQPDANGIITVPQISLGDLIGQFHKRGGRAHLEGGGIADMLSDDEKADQAYARELTGSASADIPPPSTGGLASHPDLEATRAAPGSGGHATPPDLETSREPPGMGPAPTGDLHIAAKSDLYAPGTAGGLANEHFGPGATGFQGSEAAKAPSRYTEIPDYLQPLFEKVEGGESGGRDVLYGNKPVPPGNVIPGAIGPTGQPTHAFSEFQFQPDTWNAANAARTQWGLSPLNKDNRPDREWAALYTARRDYRDRTGRDLDDDAKAGNIDQSALHATWTSLGGGGRGGKSGLAGRTDAGDPVVKTGLATPNAGDNGLAGPVSAPGSAHYSGTHYEPGVGASPWLALAAAGFGAAAGRSPYAATNFGAGGLEGVKVLGQQEAEKMRAAQLANEAENRQATLGIEQQRLTQTGKFQAGELANRAQELGLRQDEMLQRAKQFAQTMGLDYDKLDEQKKRDVIEGAYKNAVVDIRQGMQDRGTWNYGMGPDPNDPTKKVGGSWFLPIYGGEPVFHAGKGAPKQVGGGGQQTVYQHLIDSGAATDEADAIKKVALWRSDPGSFKNSAAFAGLVGKEAASLRTSVHGMTMPEDQLNALAQKNVLETFGKTPGAAPAALVESTAGTRDHPLIPRSQADIDNAPSGTVFQTPNGLMTK